MENMQIKKLNGKWYASYTSHRLYSTASIQIEATHSNEKDIELKKKEHMHSKNQRKNETVIKKKFK